MFFVFFFVFVVFMRKYVICNNINLMKDYYVLFFHLLLALSSKSIMENDRDVILSSLVIQNTHNQNNSNCNI